MRSRFTKPAFGHGYPRSSGSVALFGYGWKLNASISGRVRPLARYQAPSARTKRTGDVEMLLFAFGLSFPRGERPIPTTWIAGSIVFSESYAAARYRPNVGPGGVRARARELRPPERRLIGLVADDELPHLGIDLGDSGDVRGEERRAPETRLDLPRRVRVHGEHDAQTRVERVRDDPVEEPLVLDDECLARLEANADHRLPEADSCHLAVHLDAVVGRMLRRVVVGSHIGGRGGRGPGQEHDGEGHCRSEESHSELVPRAPLSPAVGA